MKETLKKLVKKEWRIPYSHKVMRIIHAFSLTERIIFFLFVTIFIGSGIVLLYQVSKSFMVEVPDYGGTLTEGVIGSPRFVNPILATSDIDRDLTSLIYSGLLKVEDDGTIIPDLAKSYSISNDLLTYTFVLRDNLYFHDGTKVSTDDVIFTVEKAQDSSLKSPRKTNWDGVKVEKIDDKTIRFTLRQPYAPFIQNLTLGILPKHIWNKATTEEFPFSQFNIKPTGTGPYKINFIGYSSSGLPNQYNLISNDRYSLGRPYITNVVIKSYQNEKDIIDGYKSGGIESLHSISPKELPNLKVQSDEVFLFPLPRIFGVFFNQNVAPIFVNKEVRLALNIAADKQEIVDKVLGGFGQTIDQPIPPKTTPTLAVGEPTESVGFATTTANIVKAKSLLISKGWKLNSNGIFEKKDKKKTVTLAFSISTGDNPELKRSAELLQKQWQLLGAEVDVKIFEVSDLNQNVIRTRKYDALLFGEIIGRDLDLYPFWHSSQRIDPGLNIALYANIKADKLLENIRKTGDPDEAKAYFDKFNKEIENDVPAVFTYSPYFIYIVPKKVRNISTGTLTTPSERFTNIYKWYIETNNVWKIFVKN
ncbi:MAG: hypothetical protein HY507_02405 [Candidatus Zambryskibacteria bacterium]|nr:hypothetical protein [Candidatus Zambryskibacteria bacterium]